MASEQKSGTAGNVAGRAEAVSGEWLASEQLRAQRLACETVSQLQQRYPLLLSLAARRLGARQQPGAALLVAAGLLAGLLLWRR